MKWGEAYEKYQAEVESYVTRLHEFTLAKKHYHSILLPNIFRNHQAMKAYNPRIGEMIEEGEPWKSRHSVATRLSPTARPLLSLWE